APASVTAEPSKAPLQARPAEASPKAELAPLAESLSAAMRKNPDIRVAEAKFREAEAELNRTRLEVMQKVMTLRHGWQTQQKLVEQARQNVERLKAQVARVTSQYKRAAASHLDLDTSQAALKEAEVALLREEARLAEIEATIPYLLGEPPRGGGISFIEGAPLPGAPDTKSEPEAAAGRAAKPLIYSFEYGDLGRPRNRIAAAEAASEESIRQALLSPTTLKFEKTSLTNVLEYLHGLHGLHFLIDEPVFEENQIDDKTPITLSIEKVTLAGALQALEDSHRGLRLSFVVRDYGIFVTIKGNEPDEAVPVRDFIRQSDGGLKFLLGPGGGYGAGFGSFGGGAAPAGRGGSK
ncbi:MAG: TolC family protein, partial [Planctomycetes bacterium]|nr:TolC family protein [Planctomycetota bacterium]